MTVKRELPPGVRGAIASARAALAASEPEVVKDQAELVADAEVWRDETYEPEGEAE